LYSEGRGDVAKTAEVKLKTMIDTKALCLVSLEAFRAMTSAEGEI